MSKKKRSRKQPYSATKPPSRKEDVASNSASQRQRRIALMMLVAAVVAIAALFLGRRQLGWNGARVAVERQSTLPPLPAAQSHSSESKISFTDFIGAEACQPCHAEQYDLWKKSTHGNAGGEPGQTKVIAKFNGVPLHFKDAVVVPARNPNGEYVFVIKPNGQPEEEIKVAAIIGGGHMMGGGTQSFFAKYPDGTLKFLPFDFIRDENTWFVQLRARNDWAPVRRDISLNDLANWPPHRILGTEPQHSNCQNCHGSQIFVQYDATTRQFVTRYQTLQINCESCHGPGRRHIELMQSENAAQLADIGMAPLSTLSKEQSLEVCFQCHATKDAMQSGYLPGKSFTDHYAVKFPILGSAPYLPDGRVRHFAYQENHLYSACYLEGSMTCVDCHDPHSQNYRDVFGNALPGRFDNAQCTGCHASKAQNAGAHSHHRTNSPGNSCVACHMPYLQHQLLGTRLRFARSDHSIPIPRPAFDAQLGIENACSKCHRERPVEELQAQVERWYGKLKPHHVQVANFMTAQSANDFKTAAALLLNASPSHPMAQTAALSQFVKQHLRQDMEGLDAEVLTRLKLLAESNDLEVRALALVALHAGAGNDRNVRAFLIEKLQTAGASENALRRRWAIAMDYLGVMAGERGDFKQAIAAHQKALEIIPEDYATLMNLGIAYQSEGDLKQAIATLQQALLFAPEQAALHFQLAQAYLAAQQFSAARASLQEGLRYDPDNESAKDLLQQLQSP